MAARRESDLYAPVKTAFEQLGFVVRGEVGACDLAASRGDELVVVELKTSFCLDLLYQAVDRQAMADSVYVAVERLPAANRVAARRWTKARSLCRRLSLGLVTVTFGKTESAEPIVEFVCDPSEPTLRRSPKRRSRLAKELASRTADHNVGGTTRRARVTAYRERALAIAAHLHANGPQKPSAVKRDLGVEKPYDVLHRNVYGWFVRTAPAQYGLTDAGELCLMEFAHVVEALPQLDRSPTVASSPPAEPASTGTRRKGRRGTTPTPCLDRPKACDTRNSEGDSYEKTDRTLRDVGVPDGNGRGAGRVRRSTQRVR